MRKHIIFFISCISFVHVFSLPIDPNVVAGTMSSRSGRINEMNMEVSDRAIVNWKSFSIASNESVKFFQPSQTSAILNRVTGKVTSELLGKLEANGSVFLINPQGVIIGKDAVINAGSFLTSTLDIADSDFLKQIYKFSKSQEGAIINYGTIQTTSGDITLLGRKIENHGKLESNSGCNIALAEEVLLTGEDEKIIIRVKLLDENDASFTNLGEIQAIKTEIKSSGNAYGLAINLDGQINKPSVVSEGGRFYLLSDKGKVNITGNIQNNEIVLQGKDIAIKKDAQIEATDNGSINIIAEKRLNMEGSCIAKGGEINIQKLKEPLSFWHHGKMDVSAKRAGNINIEPAHFKNNGLLLADSKEEGGNITIKAETIIDMQKAKISASSQSNTGGIIDVQAEGRFFTSGSYLAKGQKKEER